MASFSLSQLLLCATVVTVPNAHAACPAGAIQGLSPYNCFIIQPALSSWFAAEESCVRANGHLASVSSGLTNSFLFSKVVTQSCPAAKYWLGGSYNLQQSGIWTWSDGQRFSYSNWARGQPLTGATYCLSVNVATGRWYSDSCGDARPSLCRVPPLAGTVTTTTPMPSTLNCPNGWTYIEQTKKCYQIPPGYTSWNQGLAKCRSLGGTLASIPNAAANAALYAFANKTDGYAANHIGLYGGIGNWKWTDGTPVSYTNWNTVEGFPVNGAGDCGDFHDPYEENADKWYNIGCDNTGYTLLPLCQRDPGV